MSDTLSIEKITIDEQYYLSPPTLKDVPAYVEYFKEKVYSETTFIPYPYTEKDGEFFIQLSEEKNSRYEKPLTWCIRNEKGELIGGIGFHDDKRWNDQADEVGYWLGKAHWGQGIMTKALQRFCQYGAEDLGLVRITAHIYKGNEASIALAKRCGFEKEGELKKCIFKNGKYIDAELYAWVK